MATKNEVAKADKKELTMSGYFTSELERISGALPADFNKQRFALNFVSLIQEDSKLQKYPKEVLATALVRSAQDNLDALNNEVYIHEGYGGKLAYTISYKGLKKMAIEKSVKPISQIYSKLIKEGDVFDEEFVNGQAHIHFKSKFGNTGPIIGVFSVCVFQDGTEIYEVMTKDEIDACKAQSKNSQAWVKFYGEMAKKSCVRRLCKQITLDFRDKQQADMFTGVEESISDPKEQATVDIEQNANKESLEDADVVEVVVETDGQTSFVTEE